LSIYSALFAGVSGLNAQSTAMASVADNITNINTVGYKSADAQFRSLVSGSKSAATYSAGGVTAVTHALVSKQGVLTASGSTTDLGIDGAGFFVTRDGPGADANVAYTRAGSFTPDKTGYLKNASGYFLQGWPLDAQGGYANTGSLGTLVPVRLSQLTGTAAATSKLQMRANLDSTAAAFTGAYTAGDIAAGTTPAQFSRPFDISDAQGGTHTVTLAFLKTGPNAWVGEIYATPASDVTATGGLLASGAVAFNGDGSLNLAASDPGMFAALTPTWTNGAGTGPITIGLGTNGGLDGLTQFGGTSSLISSTVDGGLLGSVASVKISDAGIVSAVFEDGTTRAVYQLPLANFQNPDALTRLPGNAYAVSDDSGGVAINAPGSLGAGMISAKTLEASTVDLAQEFTNMIRFQRAYSASSKIVTTVDEMLQEMNALKR
jgi:flagellar hook protein FlgE